MRTARTPFLATRPATPRDLLSAAAVTLGIVTIAGAIAPFATIQAGTDTGFMSGAYMASIVAQGMIAFLLYGQYRAGRHSSVGFLAIAFGLSAFMLAAFWLEYPSVIRQDGVFPIAPGHAGYLWTFGKLGALGLIVAFALTAHRLRPLDRVVFWTAIGVGLAALAVCVIVVTDSAALPRLSVRGDYTPLTARGLLPGMLVLGLVALITVVSATRLQRWIDVYVGVFVAALVAETYLLLVGPHAFSLGWYGSRWEIAIGSLTVGIALIRQVNVMYRQLTTENRRLARAAMIDPLTGIANRRAFDAQLETLDADAILLVIDVDRFKSYNDLEGHRAGDDCLRRVARSLAANVLRADDLIARYGGDEFAAILHSTDLEDGIRIAERIRRAVSDLAIPAHEEGGIVTVSIGVAAYLPGEGPIDLLRRADEALYRAKAGGRDRVAFDEEEAATAR
ncbi:MAG: GGDEF domain-containing protein [Candidatus Eremiobacteraeota bacterium]|nr:GGDEF domain-containing protein [Candidatus Eremiobacteraeota bacterium]